MWVPIKYTNSLSHGGGESKGQIWMTFLSNWNCQPVTCPWGPALSAFQTCALPWRTHWKTQCNFSLQTQCIFSLHKQLSRPSACTCNSCWCLKLRHAAFHCAMVPRALQFLSPATPPPGPHSPSPVCVLPISHSRSGDAPALSSHHLATLSGAITAFNSPKLSQEHSTRVVGPLLRMPLKPLLSHRG